MRDFPEQDGIFRQTIEFGLSRVCFFGKVVSGPASLVCQFGKRSLLIRRSLVIFQSARKISQTTVVLNWAATGQVCDVDGRRTEDSDMIAGAFASSELAKSFCSDVLRRRPFVECHLYSADMKWLETIHSTAGFETPFRLPAGDGRYRVRLTEWFSRARLSENGEYLCAAAPEPQLEFGSYRSAKRYCDSIARRYENVAPWIYGPDGAIMECAGHDVVLGVAGEIVYLSRWKSFWRKLRQLVE